MTCYEIFRIIVSRASCSLQGWVVKKAFLRSLEIATVPFEVDKNKYVLVMTNAFSKWTKLKMPNKTAETTLRSLMDIIILHHGPSKIIIRGHNFTSRLFNRLCQELRTKH